MNLVSLFRPTPTSDLVAQRQQRSATKARQCLVEVDTQDLSFGPFGTITHRDGHSYKAIRGVVEEPRDSSAVAFYLTSTHDLVYLEPVRR